MYEEIARLIRQAERDGNKIAMFHYQVLINANELADVDAHDFCHRVGMKDSFATEFRKMLALAKLMKQLGKSIK